LDGGVDGEVGDLGKDGKVGAVAAVEDGVAADVAATGLFADGLREDEVALKADVEVVEDAGGHDVGGDGAFHVGGAAAPEFAVADFAGKGTGALPLFGLLGADGDDVGVGRPDEGATAAGAAAGGDDVGAVF